MDDIRLLEEYTEVDGQSSQIITEEKEGKKTYKIRGCFSKSGVKLGVSTRGNGSVKKVKMDLGEGVMEDVDLVQPGFRLYAIDVVFSPSASQFGRPDFLSEGYNGGKPTKKLFDIWKENFS